MRAFLPSFTLRSARTLDEALTLLAQPDPRCRPLAGGTDLMVQLAADALRHHHFLSIWGIGELRAIDVQPDRIGIGALATFTDLQRHPLVCAELPLLVAAAREIGGVANQNRATIGGNIANASPAADSAPALLVYDAEVEVASLRARRRVPYAAFHLGYKQLDLAADELITRVWLPRSRDAAAQSYRKVGARRAQAISKVCFAASAATFERRIRDVRLAFGSVAPTVLRARRTEQLLEDAELTPSVIDLAAATLAAELAPIDDIRSTARYRALVAQNLLREFLQTLAAGSQP